jgi:hypothetical protein
VEISDYQFVERKAYKPRTYRLFLLDEGLIEDLKDPSQQSCSSEKYSELFKALIIIDKKTSLSIFSFSQKGIEDQMISGFLSALDTFVEKFSGSSNLEEINYQGFMINAGLGKEIKTIAILSESTDKVFKERLQTFTEYFEKEFSQDLESFSKTGNQAIFRNQQIEDLICNILAI